MNLKRTLTASVLVVGAVAVSAGVGGCASAPEQELVLGVPEISAGDVPMPESVEAKLEKRYHDALESPDVAVATETIAPSERVDDIRGGAVDVTFGCVGELLEQLDATKADQLRQLYAQKKNPDPAKWRDIVHSSMLGSLPADVGVSDPGISQPCPSDGLPQNLVALYNKEAIDRWDRTDLNNIAGGVTDKMIGVKKD